MAFQLQRCLSDKQILNDELESLRKQIETII